MKKFILVLGFILIFTMVFVGCEKTKETVTITTDINRYTPFMSSKQGITMTPNFISNKKHDKLEYHWTAERGLFILLYSLEKEVVNEGENVLWSAIEDEKVVDIKEPFNIHLEVLDSETRTVLTRTMITIKADGIFYEVENEN